jgi:predicted site-specific integrase-resolvase
MIKISGREVTYAQFVNDVAKAVASELQGKRKAQQKNPTLVTAKEAASILGISTDRLRHIKDRFDCVKSGEGKQSRLLFNADTLLKCYTQI